MNELVVGSYYYPHLLRLTFIVLKNVATVTRESGPGAGMEPDAVVAAFLSDAGAEALLKL